MADWTTYVTKKGWAGDIRRNTVVVTGTNADTLPPALVGLAHIHAVVPTGHNGVIVCSTATGSTSVTVIPASGVSLSTTEGATAALSVWSAADSPAAFTGSSAELYVFGV